MKIEISEDQTFARVWAPAKINLFFEVLGKREDGYHEIETLATPISLFDQLEFTVLSKGRDADLSIECFDELGRPDKEIPTDDRNLVSRAYRVFFDALGSSTLKLGLRCKIFKKIPSKAGLGGGSSDAAATFVVLNALCGRPFEKEELQSLAGQIGSDVPLFLEKGASLGFGRGEIVIPFELPKLNLVILKPDFGLSTADVYRQCSNLKTNARRSLTEYCKAISTEKSAESVAKGLANRLEEASALLWDGVGRRRSLLTNINGALGAQMTGSGTAFFAIFANERAASAAYDSLQQTIADNSLGDLGSERVFIAKTITNL